MKITIVLGSVRIGRQTHRAARYLDRELGQRKIESDLIDLAETSLPVLEAKPGKHPDPPEYVAEIGQRLEGADALIFITPEYHGSISGALKNALDYYWSEFQKKPIGVATTSTGKFGGINAAKHLQEIILSIGAFPMPLNWLVPGVHQAFDKDSRPQNDQVTESAQRFLDEFIWFADAFYQKKKR